MAIVSVIILQQILILKQNTFLVESDIVGTLSGTRSIAEESTLTDKKDEGGQNASINRMQPSVPHMIRRELGTLKVKIIQPLMG